jgi:antibiotic biosynthesis monooxygenase (ABM) superfamily enzyme
MLRYSLLRIMLLFGCLLVLWLLGAWLPALRDPVWLLLGTAVTSVALSYFVLRGPREALARQLADKVDQRTARRRTDADEEDLEVRRQLGDEPPSGSAER